MGLKNQRSKDEHYDLQNVSRKPRQHSPVRMPHAISNKLTPSQKEKAKHGSVDLLELHKTSIILQNQRTRSL